MKFTSSRLGVVEVPDDDVIGFPAGLYGFENERGFAILPFDKAIECPLEWMHSLQNPDLAFVITDPYIFVPHYKMNLLETEKAEIQLDPGEAFATRVIINIPRVYTDMTANLVAPIAINVRKRIAKQFILTTLEYDTRHYLFPDEVRNSKMSAV
jgi:flagellar assembly factor FliW